MATTRKRANRAPARDKIARELAYARGAYVEAAEYTLLAEIRMLLSRRFPDRRLEMLREAREFRREAALKREAAQHFAGKASVDMTSSEDVVRETMTAKATELRDNRIRAQRQIEELGWAIAIADAALTVLRRRGVRPVTPTTAEEHPA